MTLEIVDNKMLKKAYKDMLRNNIVWLILKQVNAKSMSGYDVVEELHDEFAERCSIGTIYGKLHALEQNGFVVSEVHSTMRGKKKRVYSITNEGMAYLMALNKAWELMTFV